MLGVKDRVMEVRSNPCGRRLRTLLPLASLVVAVMITVVAVSCVASDKSQPLLVVVGPQLRDCMGVAPMKCLVVNGELFYDEIMGFEYESGFIYRLEVVRFDQWNEIEESMEDVSRYGYRLIRIITKTRAR